MKSMMLLLGCILISSAAFGVPATIQISKCTVTAGKGTPADSISISGTLNTAGELAGAAEVQVDIQCPTISSALSASFAVTETTLKNGKFKGTFKDGKSISVFTCNTLNDSFTFTAKKVNLTGLCCPFTLTITIGHTVAQLSLDEPLVNGNKLCPSLLMMGVWNNLDVPKFAFKPGKTTISDSFSAQGTFSVSGQFDFFQPFVLTLGGQTFTVPGRAFKWTNEVASCTNASVQEGGLISAKFDTNTGIFSIALKNASITSYGDAALSFNLFGVTLDELKTVDLGPKMTNSMWDLTRYDNNNSYWNYTTSPGSGELIRDVYNSYSNYTVTDDEIDAQAELSFYKDTDGAYLDEFVLDSDFLGGEIHLDSFDILYWPAELRRGQTYNSPSSTLSGYIKAGWNSIDVEGTILSNITVAFNLSPVVYKGQTYQTVQFTEVLDIKLNIFDPYDSSSVLGTIGIKLTTKNYAASTLGILKFTRSAKISARIPGYGSGSQTVSENAFLVDTNADR